MADDWIAMQIIVLVVFGIVLTFGEPGMPRLLGAPAPWYALVGGVAAYLSGAAGLTWWTSRWGLRRLMTGQGSLSSVAIGHHRRQVIVQMWLVVPLAMLVLSGLCDGMAGLPVIGRISLLSGALALAAFFAACVIYWRMGYAFDRAVRMQVEQDLMLAGQPVRAGWNARQHLAFNIRHHFLFVGTPIAMIMLATDLLEWLAPLVIPARALLWAEPVASAVVVGGVFLFAPLVLIRVWRTRSMPPGELRDRMERLCQRIGMRYQQIRIWDTGGVIVNAGVMGLHRCVRFVLISDAMLEQMDDRQILAVFGHEAGHVKHHHMGHFLIFTLAALLACMLAAVGASAALGLAPLGEMIAMLVAMGLAWGFGFGWLSRRFERQADVYGAWCSALDAETRHGEGEASGRLADGFGVFAAALDNVARLNGMSRNGRNWRHGSIASRVNFLMNWVAAGRSRELFDRHVRTVKLLVLAVFVAGVVVSILLAHVFPEVMQDAP